MLENTKDVPSHDFANFSLDRVLNYSLFCSCQQFNPFVLSNVTRKDLNYFLFNLNSSKANELNLKYNPMDCHVLIKQNQFSVRRLVRGLPADASSESLPLLSPTNGKFPENALPIVTCVPLTNGTSRFVQADVTTYHRFRSLVCGINRFFPSRIRSPFCCTLVVYASPTFQIP